MRIGGAALALGLLLASPRVLAQTPSANTTAAQVLFDDAKALMKAGHYDQACPKLEESQRLDPGGGTLVALALCYEGQGRLGSAWTTWDLALSNARSEHRPEREALATTHIRDLEKKLPRMRVVVPETVGGLEVVRDGTAVPSALWGTAVPVDPGTHRVEARAPGKQPWNTTAEVPAQPTTVDVLVPRLVDAPAPPATAPTPAPTPAPAPFPSATPAAPAPAAATPAPASAAPAESSSGSLRTWAFVVGGVGIAAAGAGAVFVISAASKWSDAHDACPQVQCGRSAVVNEANDAGKAADVATVLFAVGGVAVATSAVMFLLSASHGEPAPTTTGIQLTPWVGPSTGIALSGSL